MRTCRVAFAGLPSLSEDIFREAFARRPAVEFVSPWPSLPSLESEPDPSARDVLLIVLESRSLPTALHALLGAAPGLYIVGMSDDMRTASFYSTRGSRTVFFDRDADQLCQALDDEDPR